MDNQKLYSYLSNQLRDLVTNDQKSYQLSFELRERLEDIIRFNLWNQLTRNFKPQFRKEFEK